MNRAPKVSVLIPVYNRQDLVAQTVRSALQQQYDNLEVVVVDNHSSDSTFAVLTDLQQEDARLRIFQNEENLGPVRNWQRCVAHATGEYAKILFSDDLMADNCIMQMVPYLVEHPDVGFVITATSIFQDTPDYGDVYYQMGPSGLYDSSSLIKGLLLRPAGLPSSPGCAMFRRQDLKEVILDYIPNRAGVDLSRTGAGPDRLIFLLTALRYSKYAFDERPLNFFRSHAGSISVSAEKAEIKACYLIGNAYFMAKYCRNRTYLRWQFNKVLRKYLAQYGSSNKHGIRILADFYPPDMAVNGNLIRACLVRLLGTLPEFSRAERK